MTKNLPLHHLASGIMRLLPRIPCVDDSCCCLLWWFGLLTLQRKREEMKNTSEAAACELCLSFTLSCRLSRFLLFTWSVNQKIQYGYDVCVLRDKTQDSLQKNCANSLNQTASAERNERGMQSERRQEWKHIWAVKLWITWWCAYTRMHISIHAYALHTEREWMIN